MTDAPDDSAPGLPEDLQRTLAAIRGVVRTWPLELQAEWIWLRMVNCGQVEFRVARPEDISAIVAALKAMAEVEAVAAGE